MEKKGNNTSFVTQKGTALLLAITFLLGFGLTVTAVFGYGGEGTTGENGEVSFVETPEATARTLAGDCPAGLVCRERCLITVDGQVIAQGIFSCVDPTIF